MKRIAAIAVVVVGLVAGSTVPAFAGLDDDLSELSREMESLRSQVSGVRSERTELVNLILDTGTRLQALADDLATAESRLADTDREIALTEFRMDDLSDRMARRTERVLSLGSDIDEIRADAVERAIELYMQGDPASSLSLFQIEDVARFNVGMAYASRVQEAADRLITDLESLTV